jgi:hypothetical protein
VVHALTYLLELAASDAGYLLHGVRGWALARDVEEGMATWSAAELMAGQAECGRATRVDVRAPGEPRAVWVYRISQRGIDDLAAAVGTVPAGIDPPRAKRGPGVYIRFGAWVALSTLRAVAEKPMAWERVWVEGERGWKSSLELNRLVEAEDQAAGVSPVRTFLSEDLAWLVRLGLVERRVLGRTHVYRITPAGAALKRLEWRFPSPP